MKRHLTLFALFIFLVGTSNAQTGHHSGTPYDIRSVLQSRGEGTVMVEPDQATLRFSIVTEHKNPQTAMQLNEDASGTALRAVRSLGIADRHLQVQNIRLEPKREWNEEGRRWVELGYEARRFVSVTVTDLDVLPNLVSAVVDEGANRLEQLQYELADRSAAELEALGKAVANAKARAMAMAAALGSSKVVPIRVIEEGASMPEPVLMARSFAKDEMAQMGGAPDPAAWSGGLIEVRVAVSAEFAFRSE
ncbi:MAG: SIMPL domain-containing protein [Rhodothermales bacterium]